MYEQKGLEIVKKRDFGVKNLDFVKINKKDFFCLTRVCLRGSKFGSPGMILSGIEAELHKDSIFNVKTYYFMGFRPDVDQISQKIRANRAQGQPDQPGK